MMAGEPAGLPVLMYHSVSAVPGGPLRDLAVPPRRLAEQLGALRDAGHRLVGLSAAADLLAAGGGSGAVAGGGSGPVAGSGGPRLVAVTFDDGYADFLRAGLPVLADLDVTATLYPAVGHLGGPAEWLGRHAVAFGPLLSWAELREVAAAGVEIGSHSLYHHPLDVLPAAQVRREVAESRDRLEQELGRPVRSFCYPHGYHDRRVRRAVAEAGHDSACEVGRRLYRAGDDRFAVPRLQPTPDHAGADLVGLVATGGPQAVARAKRAAGPAWRAVRRVAHRFGGRLT